MSEAARARRLRIILAWVLSALLLGAYGLMPEGPSESALDGSAQAPAETEPGKLDIVGVSPSVASPGSALEIYYVGPEPAPPPRVFAGKKELEVLAQKTGSLIARLPLDSQQRRIKVRVVRGEDRSKPFDVQIQPVSWQKMFRNLVGGLALLLFGIAAFSRGAREAIGVDSAAKLTHLARRSVTALLLGVGMGALLQSTTAMAGLLVGLVGTSLLAVGPAAAAFLGAGIGATTMPLLTGIIAPREGLLVVAVGVLVKALAPDRRFAAIGRVVLGAGFVAFGLFLLRQGFEPFVSSPTLLPIVDRLSADSWAGLALASLLGAALVAALQSPAPVIVLVLGFAQTTGHWDLKTAVAVLSGSGLGAAVGGLLTMPASRRSRRLVEVNLLLGALSTLIAASTAGLWASLADRLVAGAPQEMSWGKRVLLPNLGLHLGVALALSQAAVAVLLVPVIPFVVRAFEKRFPDGVEGRLPQVGDAAGVVRSGLVGALRRLTKSLVAIERLALSGGREAGREAEHELSDARAAIEELVAGPVTALPASLEGAQLSGAMFASRQLVRSLEGVLTRAEELVDRRIALSAVQGGSPSLPGDDQQMLREMQGLLQDALSAVLHTLETRTPTDIEAARSREIRVNGLEARARRALLVAARDRAPAAGRLAVLELADAYEAAGNQAYRLAEALGGTAGLASRPSNPPPREAAGA
jgi:hypothetical protein